MNAYLKDIRKYPRLLKPLTIVIGNESCDLDSAVCAITLAYFYETVALNLHRTDKQRIIIPVLNISRENLPLKTEVTYLMRKHGIDIDDLICCDEIPEEIYADAKFILVDHHVARFPVHGANVIEVIDHRPLDLNVSFPDECKVKLSPVGSCATLIADKMRSSGVAVPDCLQLLHATILLDTLNFSTSADKARQLDVEVVTEIEQMISFDRNQRAKLFDELVRARNNVDSLTAYQLLSKDLKIITDSKNSSAVAIPGFPILVQDYIRKPNAWDAVMTFATTHNFDAVVLMGMRELDMGEIRRDLAVVPMIPTTIGHKILQKLLDSKLGLQVVNIDSKQFGRIHLYEQSNVKASRKQILPLVQQTLL